jgi:RNA polymerase sigma-70 factor (ECF subfamily)
MPEPPDKAPVTELLQQWSGGDRRALDQLLPIIHSDLRDLARRRLRALPPGSSMQATALVNEVYLRLVDARGINLRDRAHFFAISATLMRQVIIDAARSRGRKKRGGGWQRISLDDSEIPSADSDENLLALDDAMERLAVADKRKAQVVEMRFFGGMTNGEIAEYVGVSVDTIKRDWTFARLWLAREIKGSAPA